MKTVVITFLFFSFHIISLAQSSGILILPENGVETHKSAYQSNNRILIKTQAENYGFIQKKDDIELGTFISEANGGFASFGTTGPYNFCLSTKSEEPQLMLTTLNFMGIGGIPFNALHVYGNTRITDIANKTDLAKSFIKVDNNGTLTSEMQTGYYSFPRSAFSPLILSDGNSIAESAEGGIYYTLSKTTSDWLEAPLILPVGARITDVEFYFIDNSEANLRFLITNNILGNKTDFAFLILNSDNASTAIRSIGENNLGSGYGIPIKEDMTYHLRVEAFQPGSNKKWDGQNTQLIGAKVTYKY